MSFPISFLVDLENPFFNIIYEMGSSYTFFKPSDLSRSNGQKKILINTNILIDLIYYLLFNKFYTYF